MYLLIFTLSEGFNAVEVPPSIAVKVNVLYILNAYNSSGKRPAVIMNMKNRKIQLFSFVLIGLLFLLAGSQSNVVASNHGDTPGGMGGSDNFQIDTGDITVKVVGGQNVPFYTFWETDNNDTQYRLHFMKVFEASDNDSDGVYDVAGDDKPVAGPPDALASLSWEFSDVTTDDDGTTHFNITSSDGKYTFVNHIGENANSLKFDVIISNYEFTSTDSILVLAFSLTETNADASEASQEGNRVSFGDAFFEVDEEAEDSNGDVIGVGLSSSDETNSTMAYMSYEQFDGQLIHDPTIGIQADASDIDGDSSETGEFSETLSNVWPQEIPKASLLLSTITVSFIAIAVPALIYRKKLD